MTRKSYTKSAKLTDANGMPSATGQPHPASTKPFVTPVPKSKTSDTSRSTEVKSPRQI